MSGKPVGSKLQIDDQLYNILCARLRAMGWDSTRHFVLGSKLPFSAETAGRAFKHNEYKGIEAYTLAVVMLYLEYTRTEIKEMLETYTNDDLVVRLINCGGDDSAISRNELALIEAVRPIAEKDPSLFNQLAGTLRSLAVAYGLDISDALKRMTRTSINRRGK